MPYKGQSRFLFRRESIESLRINPMGIYRLYRDALCIYIGKGDIRKRLLEHLNGDNPCITREAPNYWDFEEIINMDEREKQLIRELDPVCNKKMG